MPLPEWSDLHRDLLEQIAIKLNEFEDFTAFRGVCSSWRGSTTKDKFVSKKHKIPLLMIAAEEGCAEFYSWRKKQIVSRMAVQAEIRFKKLKSVGFGWILTVYSGKLYLLNSMFSAKIQLPNTFHEPEIHRAVLSANPSQSSDFVLIVISRLKLAFWRNGDSNWTKIETIDKNYFFRIYYYKHKMYAIDHIGCVWMCDPYLSQLVAEKILPRISYEGSKQSFVVESSKGELLLIGRDIYPQTDRDYITSFLIDTVKREYRRIQSLDGDAIFITSNVSVVSVAAADFPGVVKPDCVYFLNNKHGKTNMTVYDVEHGIELVDEQLDVDVDSSSCIFV